MIRPSESPHKTRDWTDRTLLHKPATVDYEWLPDQFHLSDAIHFAAYQVGRKRGWGPHRSSALPIEGNSRFLEAFLSGELRHASLEMRVQFASTSDRYVDAVVFTAEEEHAEGRAPCEPGDVDTGAPLIGAGAKA